MKNIYNIRSVDFIEIFFLKYNIYFFMYLKYIYLKERSQYNYFVNDVRGILII